MAADHGTKHRRPKRRPLRLARFNYAEPRSYFVTMVVQDRQCVSGDVAGGEIQLSRAGRMVACYWRELAARWSDIEVVPLVVMPNHLHAIVGTHNMADPPELGRIVGAFKLTSARAYRQGADQGHWPNLSQGLWQRGFFDHVIRDETDAERIVRYIADNPIKWATDPDNPANVGP